MASITIFAIAAMSLAIASPAHAQSTSLETEAMISGLQDGNAYLRQMVTTASEQMSDEDFSFRPTQQVRSFGQLIAHIADTNFGFCATAKAEKPPMSRIEQEMTEKAAIHQALLRSFDYCDSIYATVGNVGSGTVLFGGKQRSPATVLMFRNYHGLLHYGNVITYMRLRGKVAPSSQVLEPK